MDILWIVLIQLAVLAVVIELFVRCMPGALRRASQQNCYRVDGTRSQHRTYREFRACNRLRRDMLAVLVLVFLTGNALYFTIDNSGTSVKQLATTLWTQLTGPRQAVSINGEAPALSSGNSGSYWQLLMISCWAVGCASLVVWGAYRAYRTFAEGVSARGAEHFHLDMTRISISDQQQEESDSTSKGEAKSGAEVA